MALDIIYDEKTGKAKLVSPPVEDDSYEIGEPFREDELNMIENSLDGNYGKIDLFLDDYIINIKERPPKGGLDAKIHVFVKAKSGIKIDGLRGDGHPSQEKDAFITYRGEPTLRQLLEIVKNNDVKYIRSSHKLRTL